MNSAATNIRSMSVLVDFAVRKAITSALLFFGAGALTLCFAPFVSRSVVYGLAFIMLVDGYHEIKNSLQIGLRRTTASRVMYGILLLIGGTLVLPDPVATQRNLTIILLGTSVIVGAYRLTAALVESELSKMELMSGGMLVLFGAFGWLTLPQGGDFIIGLAVGFFALKKGISILQIIPILLQLTQALRQLQTPALRQ
jgi:uncharacterized membrane protein HdeD (DUF308 family)